jgi:hypothetical protein
MQIIGLEDGAHLLRHRETERTEAAMRRRRKE